MREPFWSLRFAARAKQDLRRLDRPIRLRVITALENLAEHPCSHKKLIKLTNRSGFRLRVGDWRVVVDLDLRTRTIYVKHVLPRGRAYDR